MTGKKSSKRKFARKFVKLPEDHPYQKRKRHASRSVLPVLPRVIGEASAFRPRYPKSNIQKFAEKNRLNPTRAEKEFDTFLYNHNGGILRGRYRAQHPISGKWIVDFFFPEVRLAVEIDGTIHSNRIQQSRDHEKDDDAKRFDITLIRITNREVFGDRLSLINKLREGWRTAKNRPNKIIGNKLRC